MLEDDTDQNLLERRMAAVRGLRQVAQAIAALARAQLPLVERATGQATAYLDAVDSILQRLVGTPLPQPATAQLLVVVGPERAFCGALAQQLVAELPPQGKLGLVGKRLGETASRSPALMARVQFRLPGASSPDEAEAVAAEIARAVLSHAHGAQVDLLRPTEGRAELHRSILLAATARPLPKVPPETYSPLTSVIDAAVREAITGRLALAASEALRAEVAARIVAAEQMKNACDKKLEALEQSWRIARQEQITSELLEVVAGRQASLAAGMRFKKALW